jgi:hypothetical protein
MGVGKQSGIFEYSSDSIQKYKSELAETVKGMLASSGVIVETPTQTQNENRGMIKKIEEVNFDDVQVSKPIEEKPKEPEYKEPTKFKNFAENIDVKIISNGNENKPNKRNNNQKIQKVDFDFNFDNFNEVNFSSFNSLPENNNTNNMTNFDKEFGWGNSNNNNNKSNNKFEDDDESEYYKPKISKEEINKKFANKKAISSEDYANLEENPNQNNAFKNKLNNMKYSQAISSSDIYGEQNDDGI